MDKSNKKIIGITMLYYVVLASVAGVIILVGGMQLSQSNAEITKDGSAIEGFDYKIFVYGTNPESILINTDAQYEISGYPSTSIFISNWDKLTPLEQLTITSELTKLGYLEQDKIS